VDKTLRLDPDKSFRENILNMFHESTYFFKSAPQDLAAAIHDQKYIDLKD